MLSRRDFFGSPFLLLAIEYLNHADANAVAMPFFHFMCEQRHAMIL